MKKQILVLHHAKCMDGITSAYVLRKKFGLSRTIEYHSMIHGSSPLPDFTGKEVYILDFSLMGEDLINCCNVATSVTIIDHHKTFIDHYTSLKEVPSNLNIANTSTDHCGCVLTWKYLFPNDAVPLLLEYVEQRDLWLWNKEYCHEVLAYLESYFPFDFDILELLEQDLNRKFQQAVTDGISILRYMRKQSEELTSKAEMYDFMGYKVPGINNRIQVSEVLNDMGKGYPFAFAYWNSGGQLRVSLRSPSDGIDVSKVCEVLGGGGHRNAAGAVLELGDTSIFKLILN
jgi:uncharacterized protein